MDDTAEYKTLVLRTSELALAIEPQLIPLTAQLVSMDLLGSDNYEEIRNPFISPAKRAYRLVDMVRRKVQINPESYHSFIAVLLRDRIMNNEIVHKLQESYQLLLIEQRSTLAESILKEDPAVMKSNTDGDVAKGQNEISIQSAAAVAGIGLEVLSRVCSPVIVVDLSKFCRDWKQFGMQLGLTKAEISAIDDDNKTTEKKRVRMLETWRKKFAHKATYQAFIESLLSKGWSTDVVPALSVIRAAEAMEGPLQRTLTFDDHFQIREYLKNLSNASLIELGCALGLNYSSILQMKIFPDEIVQSWLLKKDEVVNQTGEPSWLSLVRTLQNIGHSGVASMIIQTMEGTKEGSSLSSVGAVPEVASSQGGKRYRDVHHTEIYQCLVSRASKWREIGSGLGFTETELDVIMCNPMLLVQGPPNSWLRSMLSQWLQWGPGDGRGSTDFATREKLHYVLTQLNLDTLAMMLPPGEDAKRWSDARMMASKPKRRELLH